MQISQISSFSFYYFTISYAYFSTVYVLYFFFISLYSLLFCIMEFCMYYLQYSLGCTLLDKQFAFTRCFPSNHPCKFLIWLVYLNKCELKLTKTDITCYAMKLFIHEFNNEFIHYFINLFMNLYIHLFMIIYTHLFMNLFITLFIYSWIYSFIYSWCWF